MQVIQYIVDLGPSVMIPIIIFILGIFLRQGVGRSLRAGISIGIGFVGINLVISLLTDNLGKAAEAMAKNFNLGLSVVDVGWPGTSPMAWASAMGLIAIPIAIAVNVIMLLTRMTKVVNMGIFAKPIDDLIEAIPGLNKITITSKTVEEKFGVLGQPSIIGAILGIIIGLLAKFPIGKSLQLGIQMAAVMVLMPVVVKFIMEGLIPISQGAKVIMDKHFKGGLFTIGMDPALLLGNSDVIAAGLLFVPITLLIAILVPGNKVLPFGDLATIGFFIAIATGVHKGNIFRTLISGSVIMFITIWISNQMYPLEVALGHATNLLAKGKEVSSLDQAGSPITYLLTKGFTGQVGIGFIVIAILFISAFAYTYIAYKRQRLYVTDNKTK